MNVSRNVYGHLMPAEFSGVLHLPHPVPRIVKERLFVSDNPLTLPVYSSYTMIHDTEETDFHGQRMVLVR